VPQTDEIHAMRTNIRRGFLRIWVVLSAAWVMAVIGLRGYDLISSFSEYQSYTYSMALNRLAEVDSSESKDFPEKVVTERRIDGENLILILPVEKPMGPFTLVPPGPDPWNALARKYGGVQVPSVDSIVSKEAMTELIDRAKHMRSVSRAKEMAVILAIAFLPPITVLALGALVAWVGRGFAAQ
jgi:hypothetical protein